MYTIATAGHIDHGKSALVQALTGKNPDRLPEEQRREMTIELGFASFTLPDGKPVGIIDVPGHERFIKTMIAGVGTLDLVMFVVAADDGWMPQSAEHLAILRYLDQKRGLIVLTKVDLAEPDWIELVKSDIRAKVEGTFLAAAEIVEFSATDNRNLDVIRDKIGALLEQVRQRELLDSARLFVDRSFTIAGVGTVVTGTLREGAVNVGQELAHYPSGEEFKVKSLESFYSHLDQAPPGIRLAVGLQSVSREEIKRGDMLYFPLDLHSSETIGVKLYPADRQAHFVKHGREIIFLHGTSEIDGRLIMPAEAVYADDGAVIASLRLDSSVITKTGDHFVLRLPTPSLLVGGGIVIDPLLPMFRRSATGPWQYLKEASSLTPEDLVTYQLRTKMILAEKDILAQSLFTSGRISDAVNALIDSKKALRRGKYVILKSLWDESANGIVKLVDEFHEAHQHLEAMSLADLESQASCPEALFELLVESLISQGKLARFEAGIKLAGYSAGLSSDLEKLRDEIVAALGADSCPALTRKELLSRHRRAGEVFAYLKQRRQIVEFGGLVLLSKNFSQLVDQITNYINKKGKITVAEARDVTGTTRKVAVPLLEEMDRRGITVRQGDFRELAP